MLSKGRHLASLLLLENGLFSLKHKLMIFVRRHLRIKTQETHVQTAKYLGKVKANLPKGVLAFLQLLPTEPDPATLPKIHNIASFREHWSQFSEPKTAGPLAEKVKVEQYKPGSFYSNPRPIRIYRPIQGLQKANTPVILCTSGGGFIANELKTNQVPWSKVADHTQYPVISYSYTPAPEESFNGVDKPQGLQEAEAMAEWLFSHAQEMGFDNENIFLMGDSSGGNFAIYQAYHLKKAGFKPKGLCLISPVADLSRQYQGYGGSTPLFDQLSLEENVDTMLSKPLVDSSYQLYAPDGPLEHPNISPLYIPDLAENLPVTVILVASHDRLKRDAFALLNKLGEKSAGLYVIPGTHAFLTARALFGNEPGPDPAVWASRAIQSLYHGKAPTRVFSN